jgi:hypothetical protein
MDRVRFGRALGYGARHAVKTLVTAVDAATAEDPSRKRANPNANSSQAAAAAPADPDAAASRTTASATVQSPPPTPIVSAARMTARTVTQARKKQRGLRHGTRRFGEAVWRPFVRLSGVLGLEVSGVFFGIFALFALAAVVRLRAAWRPHSAGNTQLLVAVAMLVVFGYFCVSNFVRARRRERGR